ncbi:MAG: hypothetical protein M3O34_06900 [Chloroflexota bacterium]|nr:hypothetical protein [Chloroflexota bacterium]
MFEQAATADGAPSQPGGQLIELAERVRPPADLALSFAEMRRRVEQLDEFYRGVMQRGTDYDLIPGTPKPTLLQPGAQLLDAIFGLAPIFEELPGSVEDFEGGFFAYKIRCRLVAKATGWTAAEAIGSCNSKENRYRWREARRRCPECGAEAITKGRPEYGGGWLCWRKTGGCGAKFRAGDESIEGQAVGKVENDDPYTLANTILKMAQKRAHIAATLNATGASRIFTQDIEDMAPAPVAVRLAVEQALATGELNPAELADTVIAGLGRAELIQLARALKAECDALEIADLPRLGPKPDDDEIRTVVREVRDRAARARRGRGANVHTAAPS